MINVNTFYSFLFYNLYTSVIVIESILCFRFKSTSAGTVILRLMLATSSLNTNGRTQVGFSRFCLADKTASTLKKKLLVVSFLFQIILMHFFPQIFFKIHHQNGIKYDLRYHNFTKLPSLKMERRNEVPM